MPFLIQCPSCATHLKSPKPVPAGRQVVCPKCQAAFTLSAPAPEVIDPPPAAAPAKPKGIGSALDDFSAQKKRAAADIPDAEFADDEDDRPPVRRRRTRNDEPDDDRPPVRSRRDEDDDPRPRRRRAVVDDDEDDEPPPRRGRSRKPAKKPLIFALVGLAALFLLCGGGALMYFVDPFGLFGGAPGEMTAWIPADARAVMFKDVEAAERVDGLSAMQVAGDVAKYGVRPDEVSAALGAGRLANGIDPEVLVIKLKTAADRKKVVEAAGGAAAQAGGKTYYRTRAGGALHFASDKLIVGTRSEPTMTTLLTSARDRGPSPELKRAMSNADGIIWAAGVGEAAERGDTIGLFANAGGFMDNPFANRSGPKAKSTSMGVKASGNTATIRFESTYDSSDVARKLADDLRRALTMRPQMGDATYDVSTSGASVILRLTGPLKRGAGPMPFPFGF